MYWIGNSVSDAIDHILSEAGRIDILVNNAGYGLVGALEDLSMERSSLSIRLTYLG